MRTYGKKFIWKKTASYKNRATRMATEWDVRLDVSDQLTKEDIISNVKNAKDGFLYVLVSGVERPDGEDAITSYGPQRSVTLSNEQHVHLCVVLHMPAQRMDVLRMLRGQRKMGDEYCAPRNPKFSYLGWVIHHSKLECKLPGEPGIWYEEGILPMDPLTTEWAVAIQRMLKKYKCPEAIHNRTQPYLALLSKNRIQEKIEQLQMSLEDNDVN